jgi:hypothetical protein
MILFLYMEHCSRIRAHSYHLGRPQTMGDGGGRSCDARRASRRLLPPRGATRRDMSQAAG